ncbi:hypothetical protein Hdeb2414_s0003g00110981 [Helianthus debilis subsp. tardiflorus]
MSLLSRVASSRVASTNMYQQTPPWTLLARFAFCVFYVGGSSDSSRVLKAESVSTNSPVTCRKCVDKLPLNISSPLNYARE